MLDFEVQRCTRRCAATERELAPGEEFYSVLVSEGGQVVRYDYSKEAWSGPPEKSVGWWKSQMPGLETKKLHWAPSDVLLHYFIELESQPERADERYVLALLLVRRRIARLEETRREGDGEVLILYCPKNETEYQVPIVTPTEKRAGQIQEKFSRLLAGGQTG